MNSLRLVWKQFTPVLFLWCIERSLAFGESPSVTPEFSQAPGPASFVQPVPVDVPGGTWPDTGPRCKGLSQGMESLPLQEGIGACNNENGRGPGIISGKCRRSVRGANRPPQSSRFPQKCFRAKAYPARTVSMPSTIIRPSWLSPLNRTMRNTASGASRILTSNRRGSRRRNPCMSASWSIAGTSRTAIACCWPSGVPFSRWRRGGMPERRSLGSDNRSYSDRGLHYSRIPCICCGND